MLWRAKVIGEKLNCLDSKLVALGERWQDRVSRKDFRAIGESYAKGRVSLLLYFDVVSGSELNNRFYPAPGAHVGINPYTHVVSVNRRAKGTPLAG